MRYLGGDISEHDEEVEAVHWLPLAEAQRTLTL